MGKSRKNTGSKLYIAYGSNMDKAQMAYRCPEAVLIGASEVENYELLFKGSKTGSYATIEKAQGRKVPVLIWKITPSDEASLDRYEGFPTFYYKKKIPFILNGKPTEGMAYIMDENRKLGVPTCAYFDVLEKAYYKHSFDLSILDTAYLKSAEAIIKNTEGKKKEEKIC